MQNTSPPAEDTEDTEERPGAVVRGHCTNSKSQIYRGHMWVRVDVEVRGGEYLKHMVDGQMVLEYDTAQIGGGVSSSADTMALSPSV